MYDIRVNNKTPIFLKLSSFFTLNATTLNWEFGEINEEVIIGHCGPTGDA